MSPYAILAAVLAFVLNGFFWYAKGVGAEDNRWKVKTHAAELKATLQARAKEQMWQETVNGTARNYEIKLAGVRRNLDTALDSLRDRPERPAGMSEAPRAGCEGANGAELSGANGRFLAGEAARANRHRAALEACYAYADALK
ncbi:MAG: hypothetical protein NUV63_11095 [Gallionella sp.]|nr:hypothetical protein [Gallionella sp.]